MNLNKIAHDPNTEVVQRFEHAGLECIVLEMKGRYYCGYVKTPFDGDYREFKDSLDVYGGLTYGLDEDGWIGFDTARFHDLLCNANGDPLRNDPLVDLLKKTDSSPAWSPEDVIEETKQLAEQVDELVPEGYLQEDNGDILE